MKKHWKVICAIALVFGSGYVIFCLAYDAYEEYQRALPQKKLQARKDRIRAHLDQFIARADSQVPVGAEMVFWEWQSWETGGGRSRLTLWSDGRSEARVWPCSYNADEFALQAEPGWKETTEGGSSSLVREAVNTEEETKQLFRNAFRLGLHLLTPGRRDYVDGQGLVIGIQKNGVLKQQTYPEFGPEHWETKNYIRFKALCGLLGEFDTQEGFKLVAKQKAANKAMENDE